MGRRPYLFAHFNCILRDNHFTPRGYGMARVYKNPVGADGKRKRGRPAGSSTVRVAAADLAAYYEETDTNETDAERIKRIAERFTIMYKLTQGSINGHVRALVVSGAPGTGKSYTIDGLLESAKDRNKIRYESVKGGQVTGINLYKLLFRMQNENDIILMDDSDSIYNDETTLNLLKGATDSTARRVLSWLSESAVLKAEDIPTQFEYKGSIIFITNKDFQAIVDADKSILVPHLQAFMSRSIYLDLKLHRPKDLIAWSCHMVEKNRILVQHGLSRIDQEMVLDWSRKNYADFRELSIRTLLKIGTFVKTDPRDWESFARCTILR